MVDKINFSEIHHGGYSSEFDSEAESSRKRQRNENNIDQLEVKKKKRHQVPNKRDVEEEYSKEEGKIQRSQILSLDAYSRHKQFVNNYLLFYGGKKSDFKRDSSRDKRDIDVIRENHQFLWQEDEDTVDSWEKRLAKKYYDKLFKEYCIADLSRYKENKFGMRWRIEKEVFEGKGQFTCGNKTCQEKDGLKSWEVNFGYIEHEEKKNALVKLRLCADCSYKLNYHHKKKEVIPKSRQSSQSSKKHKKHTRKTADKKDETDDEDIERDNDDDDDDDDDIEDDDNAGGDKDNKGDESIWSGPVKLTEEKSREEEYDEYFKEMFL